MLFTNWTAFICLRTLGPGGLGAGDTLIGVFSTIVPVDAYVAIW
jgi:hypothetical protein